ncbi:hypothetical protein SK128_027769 [Halocaridina rubra]|uniref:Uncharacterized protein n=1 Tax=Halocaridina rubra TaxID=373956 RepID=A0AAN8WF19_HALRR
MTHNEMPRKEQDSCQLKKLFHNKMSEEQQLSSEMNSVKTLSEFSSQEEEHFLARYLSALDSKSSHPSSSNESNISKYMRSVIHKSDAFYKRSNVANPSCIPVEGKTIKVCDEKNIESEVEILADRTKKNRLSDNILRGSKDNIDIDEYILRLPYNSELTEFKNEKIISSQSEKADCSLGSQKSEKSDSLLNDLHLLNLLINCSETLKSDQEHSNISAIQSEIGRLVNELLSSDSQVLESQLFKKIIQSVENNGNSDMDLKHILRITENEEIKKGDKIANHSKHSEVFGSEVNAVFMQSRDSLVSGKRSLKERSSVTDKHGRDNSHNSLRTKNSFKNGPGTSSRKENMQCTINKRKSSSIVNSSLRLKSSAPEIHSTNSPKKFRRRARILTGQYLNKRSPLRHSGSLSKLYESPHNNNTDCRHVEVENSVPNAHFSVNILSSKLSSRLGKKSSSRLCSSKKRFFLKDERSDCSSNKAGRIKKTNSKDIDDRLTQKRQFFSRSSMAMGSAHSARTHACIMSPSRDESPESHRSFSPLGGVSCARYGGSPTERTGFPVRYTSRSPFQPRNRSPGRLTIRSPVRLRSRSPVRLYSKSPGKRRNKSPVRLRNRSPLRLRSRSPARRSPVRLHNRSPGRRRIRSPVRLYSKSPVKRRSKSPLKQTSRSPVRLRNRSPLRLRSRSPVRRSPVRLHNSFPGRWRIRSPIRLRSRSPVRQTSRSPVRWTSMPLVRLRSRSPIRFRSRSPVRLYSKFPEIQTSISPVKCKSRSPVRFRSRSPGRLRSRPPVKLGSCSPVRLYSKSPVRLRSMSPVRLRSISPVRLRSKSPAPFRNEYSVMKKESPLNRSNILRRYSSPSPARRRNRSPNSYNSRSAFGSKSPDMYRSRLLLEGSPPGDRFSSERWSGGGSQTRYRHRSPIEHRSRSHMRLSPMRCGDRALMSPYASRSVDSRSPPSLRSESSGALWSSSYRDNRSRSKSLRNYRSPSPLYNRSRSQRSPSPSRCNSRCIHVYGRMSPDRSSSFRMCNGIRSPRRLSPVCYRSRSPRSLSPPRHKIRYNSRESFRR